MKQSHWLFAETFALQDKSLHIKTYLCQAPWCWAGIIDAGVDLLSFKVKGKCARIFTIQRGTTWELWVLNVVTTVATKTSLPLILQVALWAILCLFVITSFSNQTLNLQLNSTCSVPMILIHSTNQASFLQNTFFKLELNSSLAVQLPLGSNWA